MLNVNAKSRLLCNFMFSCKTTVQCIFNIKTLSRVDHQQQPGPVYLHRMPPTMPTHWETYSTAPPGYDRNNVASSP